MQKYHVAINITYFNFCFEWKKVQKKMNFQKLIHWRQKNFLDKIKSFFLIFMAFFGEIKNI